MGTYSSKTGCAYTDNKRRLAAFDLLYCELDWLETSSSAWELAVCIFDDYCYAVNSNIYRVTIQNNDIQLIAITCLMLASKYHDEVDYFNIHRVPLTLDGVERDGILAMELNILKTLNYNFLSYQPCYHWMSTSKHSMNYRDLRRLLINIAYCHPELRDYYSYKSATLVTVANKLVAKKRIKARHRHLAECLAAAFAKLHSDIENGCCHIEFLTDYYYEVCDSPIFHSCLRSLYDKKLVTGHL